MSNLRAIKPILLEVSFFMQCNISKATRMLSVISRSFANVDWCSEIRLGRNFFSLFARTSEKFLYKTLHKLIGRNSVTNSGLTTLGTRVMKVWLMGGG